MKKNKIVLALLVLICLCTGLAIGQSSYSDMTDSLNVDHTYCPAWGYQSMGGGVSFRDFNMDGYDDITFTSWAEDSLYFYLNDGGGGFNKISVLPTGSDTFEVKNVLWFDYDNDGDQDLFLGVFQAPSKLFRNDAGTFTDVSISAGIDSGSYLTFVSAIADYNLDGYLDIFVGNRDSPSNQRNYFYHNNGDGTFTERAIAAGVDGDPQPYPTYINQPLGVSFADYNNDMYPDIFVAIDHYFGNNLYMNNGDETFTDVSDSSGFDKQMGGMCVAQGDYNNDGLIDIYVSNVPQLEHGNELFRNTGIGTFDTTSWDNGTKVHLHGWGGNILDYDNDGLMDIFVCNSAGGPNMQVNLNRRNVLLKNHGLEEFGEVLTGDIILDTTGISYGTAMGDYDNDGYYDLVVLNNQGTPSRVYRNNGDINNYIKFRLTGTVSNRDAIGVHIKVYNEGTLYSRYTYCGISYGSQNSKDVIVGVGTAVAVDSIYIMWPSFITDKFYNVPINQIMEIEEGEVACSAEMQITTTKQNVSCSGANNGQASVFVSSGSPPYTYEWNTSPISTSQSISGLAGGEKQVEVRDSKNCRMNTSVNIYEPSSLFVTSIANFPEQGDINLLVSGGIAPYNYVWSNGATTEDVSGLSPGMYFVQVTDNNSCAQVHLVNLY